MLALKYLVENYELAKETLENWEHDADTLDEMLSCFRISSNAIYPFRQNGEVCFLRLAPVEEKEERNVRGELAFLLWLREQGYPAMKPLADKGGEYVRLLQTRWGSWYAAAFEGVPGKPIEETDFSDEVMLAYGKSLGRLHALSENYRPQTRKTDYIDAMEWTGKILKEQNCPAYIVEVVEQVKEELVALPKDEKHYGLVHYDFETDNVFYDEKNDICHVIDFDDGMYHFYALDMEQALDSIRGECPEERIQAAQKVFLEGYCSQFPFGEAEKEMLPAMRRFIDLYAYARLKHCLAEPVAEKPDWMDALTAKLEGKMKMLEESFL